MNTHSAFPTWTMLPFAVLIVAIAVLPLVAQRAWTRPSVQLAAAIACACPVLAFVIHAQRTDDVLVTGRTYLSFIVTIGTLYVTTSGICLAGDLQATPRLNTLLFVSGCVLASVVGTTGASVLVVQLLLRTNRQRVNRNHLVPIFILGVANAGGLLTALGDPPLLIGYLEGVPFFWTLRLLPYWALYVGVLALALYGIDHRAYAREPARAIAEDKAAVVPLSLRGRANVPLLAATVAAVMLGQGWREAAMVAIVIVSLVVTPREVHRENDFSLHPVREVAILFGGIFVCLIPVEANLALAAPGLPLKQAWQLFWCSGTLSSVLDNAPTYKAFLALARGLSVGHDNLIAGVTHAKLVAISVGATVMGATTYIGNGPNLLVKSMAERAGYTMPGFFRYAAIAALALLPMHLLVTVVLVAIDR